MRRWVQLELPLSGPESSPWAWRCARYAGRPVDGERVRAWAACASCRSCGAELGLVDGGYLVVALLPASASALAEVLAAAGPGAPLVRAAASAGGLVVCWECVLDCVRSASGGAQ